MPEADLTLQDALEIIIAAQKAGLTRDEVIARINTPRTSVRRPPKASSASQAGLAPSNDKIETLKLPESILQSLHGGGIDTIFTLAATSEDKITSLLSPSDIKKVRKALDAVGFCFRW